MEDLLAQFPKQEDLVLQERSEREPNLDFEVCVAGAVSIVR